MRFKRTLVAATVTVGVAAGSLVFAASPASAGPYTDDDDDGLIGILETALNTDPTNPDTDFDGVYDGTEYYELSTNPTLEDTDYDGLTDGLEAYSLPSDPTLEDTDYDGLNDYTEVVGLATDPTNADTDGDDINDYTEVVQLTLDPNNPDTDGDSLTDGTEYYELSTDPTNPDTDGDTLTDGTELELATNPTNPDTDGDTLTDGDEHHWYTTSPTNVTTFGMHDFVWVTTHDSDQDGLGSDYTEVAIYGTDPKAGVEIGCGNIRTGDKITFWSDFAGNYVRVGSDWDDNLIASSSTGYEKAFQIKAADRFFPNRVGIKSLGNNKYATRNNVPWVSATESGINTGNEKWIFVDAGGVGSQCAIYNLADADYWEIEGMTDDKIYSAGDNGTIHADETFFVNPFERPSDNL